MKLTIVGTGVILIVGPLLVMAILAERFLFAPSWVGLLGIVTGVALTVVLVFGMWLLWGERD